jgi:hypothetical protein
MAERLLHLIALFMLIVLCTPASRAADVRIRAAEVVAYGLFEAHKNRGFTSRFRPNAPAADSVSNVKFVEFTHDIPPVLGAQFGFQYIINSMPKGGRMNVEQVIRFPRNGLQQPGGRLYKESRETLTVKIGEPNFYGYGFDEAWEIVPGQWVFEVWHKDARLVRKAFNVLPLPDDE